MNKYIVEVTADKIIRKLIINDIILEEEWYEKSPGHYSTKGSALEDMTYNIGICDKQLLDAIEYMDNIDIMIALRNIE